MIEKMRVVGIILFLTMAACSKINNSSDTAGATAAKENRAEPYIIILKRDHGWPGASERGIATGTGAAFAARKLIVKNIISEISSVHALSKPTRIFTVAVQGAVMNLNSIQAESLAQDPRIAYLEKDQVISINTDVVQTAAIGASIMQGNPTWGLDRIDQSDLPLDHKYNYRNSSQQVNAYVIDTGILTTHQEFQGRAFHGYDFVDQDGDATDCNGHGTHVAGTIGGATYGVAKNVKIYGVRVLDCSGAGTYSSVIAGVEWVTAHHIKPAVVNMSLGGPVSQALDDAVSVSIQAGVTYVVAAGNENQSACNSSPARIDAALSVGSITKTDTRSAFSNYGPCVDVFAPGSDIQSAWFDSSTATNTISGTSMATPHVAGVAALYLASHGSAMPSEVKNAILNGSVSGRVANVGSGSSNRLINTQFITVDNPGTSDPSAPCSGCNLYTGTLSGKGAFAYQPNGNAFQSAAGELHIWLEGPSNADFDLYLYQVNGLTLKKVAASLKMRSREEISYHGLVGTYQIKVISYSGRGDYKLWRKLP